MLKVTEIRGFVDNYFWLIEKSGCAEAAVVDPGDAKPVLSYLQQQGLQLSAILITHHHGDHTGGIQALKKAYPKAKVYAPARESIAAVDYPLAEGDKVHVPALDLRFSILDVRGHTKGHIAYHQAEQGWLFCGDTLFAGGCGRVFEGTMKQMQSALAKIRALPAETQIYCAHEYTEDNLGFARWVEPDNPALIARQDAVKTLRQADKATVPSLLRLEQETNPFLRYDLPAVIAAAEQHAGKTLASAAEVFGHLRYWKDSEFD